MKYLTLICLFLFLYIYHINSFLASVTILYPLKTPENLCVFRGHEMGALARTMYPSTKTNFSIHYLFAVFLEIE